MAKARRSAKSVDHASRYAPTPLPERPVLPRGRMFASVLDLVGGTPLVRLPRLQTADGIHLSPEGNAIYGSIVFDGLKKVVRKAGE